MKTNTLDSKREFYRGKIFEGNKKTLSIIELVFLFF
jgi:hypothetical protein